eukprot:TRINITY_DN6647_c0_g1_i1.p1 TRINITY_DN6647_c0_g1~~TRINITY_DN6647_c0_g1_i1.p1  ORF type:complete len:305 (-),score=82.31 TRINITY_DN6647_c0_g1_i1:950-1864(-)
MNPQAVNPASPPNLAPNLAPNLPPPNLVPSLALAGPIVPHALAAEKKRSRSQNWVLNETLWLVRGKKKEHEDRQYGNEAARSKTAQQKLEELQQFLAEHGFERTMDQIQNKWENIFSDYRSVKEWQRTKAGEQSYFTMQPRERNLHKLPPNLTKDIFDEMDVWLQVNKPLVKREKKAGRLPKTEDVSSYALALETTEGPSGGEAGFDMGTSGDPRLNRKRPAREVTGEDLRSVMQALTQTTTEVLSKMDEKADEREAKRLKLLTRQLNVQKKANKDIVSGLNSLAIAIQNLAHALNNREQGGVV